MNKLDLTVNLVSDNMPDDDIHLIVCYKNASGQQVSVSGYMLDHEFYTEADDSLINNVISWAYFPELGDSI